MITRGQLKEKVLKATINSPFEPTEIEGFVEVSCDLALQWGFPEFTEMNFLDITGDGATTRYALLGEHVTLLPIQRQLQPNLTGYTTWDLVSWTTDSDSDQILLEPMVKVDGTRVGTSSTDVPQSTLSLSTAILTGTKIRVWYSRVPLSPPDDATLIWVDERFLVLAVIGFVYDLMANNSTGGDAAEWENLSAKYLGEAAKLKAEMAGEIPDTLLRYRGWDY